MKYVIEKNGKVYMGPAPWNQRLAGELGLSGNKDAPDVGHSYKGKILREHRTGKASPSLYQEVRTQPDVLEDGVWVRKEEVVDWPLKRAKNSHKASIKATRKTVERGGVVVDGVFHDTDKDSQASWTAAYIKATMNPNMVLEWQVGADGEEDYIDLDAVNIQRIADAVAAHVQMAFSKQRQKWKDIDKCTSVKQVRDVKWDDVDEK